MSSEESGWLLNVPWCTTKYVMENTLALKTFVQEIQHLNAYVFPAVPLKPLLTLSSVCDLVFSNFPQCARLDGCLLGV